MGERDLPEVGDGRDDLVPLEVHRPSLPAVNLLNLQNLVRGLVAQLWGRPQVLHAGVACMGRHHRCMPK